MDEKLNRYISSDNGEPPFINERMIMSLLAERKKRLSVMLLSLAGLLWSILLYTLAFIAGRENEALGVALLVAISVGYICAGWFAGIVLKYRKVVYQHG